MLKEIMYYIAITLGINLFLTFFYYVTAPELAANLFGMHFVSQQLFSILLLAPFYPLIRPDFFKLPAKKLAKVQEDPIDLEAGLMKVKAPARAYLPTALSKTPSLPQETDEVIAIEKKQNWRWC